MMSQMASLPELSAEWDAKRNNAEQALRLTNPANMSNWRHSLYILWPLVRFGLQLMKTLGHKLQAGSDCRPGYPCLDVTDANNI